MLKEGISEILGTTSNLAEYNQHYLDSESNQGVLQRAVGVEMLIFLDPEHKSDHLALLMEGGGPLGGGFEESYLTLKDCQRVHQMLLNPVFNSEVLASEWKSRCGKIFKRSSYFEGNDSTNVNDQNGITVETSN